jgi:hypothetical protein
VLGTLIFVVGVLAAVGNAFALRRRGR